MKTATQVQASLEYYYQQIKTIILSHQNPIDNVYSILAVWGLALAYRTILDGLTAHQTMVFGNGVTKLITEMQN